MEKFAKVFETHGRQFLIKKDTSDEDLPKLSVITVVEDAEINLGFTFPEHKWAALDTAFDAFGEEQAAVLGAKLENATTAFEIFKLLQD